MIIGNITSNNSNLDYNGKVMQIEFYEEGQQDIMKRYDIYNEHREKVRW